MREFDRLHKIIIQDESLYRHSSSVTNDVITRHKVQCVPDEWIKRIENLLLHFDEESQIIEVEWPYGNDDADLKRKYHEASDHNIGIIINDRHYLALVHIIGHFFSKAGHRILAIKLIRAIGFLSLKDAKELFESTENSINAGWILTNKDLF